MEFNSFFIKNLTDNITLFNISLSINTHENIISITDVRNGEFAQIKSLSEDVVFWINYISKKIFSNIKSCKKTEKFDDDYFLKIFVIVVKEREKVKGTIKKRDIFRFETIQKLKHQGFLCNNVKDFYPETKFYLLSNGRIKDSRTDNIILYEQEEKIWDFLFKNPERVGKEVEPTIYDYCAGKKIDVIINQQDTKAIISYITDLKNGYFQIKINYNGQYKVLTEKFTKDNLISRVINAR